MQLRSGKVIPQVSTSIYSRLLAIGSFIINQFTAHKRKYAEAEADGEEHNCTAHLKRRRTLSPMRSHTLEMYITRYVLTLST